MAETNYYQALGVKKGSSEAEIKQAYRKLARELHPDRNPGNKQAEERFKEVSRAYQVLSDPKKRQLYDEFGEAGLREGFDPEQYRRYSQWSGGGPQGGFAYGPGGGGFQWSGSIEDLFGAMGGAGRGGGFGGDFGDVFQQVVGRQPGRARGRRRPEPGRDIQTEIAIDFMEMVRGADKEFSFQAPGTHKPKTLRVHVPAGIPDGGTLRLRGQGVASESGGEPGNLLIEVRVRPHPFLWREGDELHMNLPVTVVEAWEGSKIEVPTPQGTISLRIPAGTQGGTKMRLKGKGIGAPGKKAGDLYAHVQLRLPEGPPKQHADAVQALRHAYQTADVRASLVL